VTKSYNIWSLFFQKPSIMRSKKRRRLDCSTNWGSGSGAVYGLELVFFLLSATSFHNGVRAVIVPIERMAATSIRQVSADAMFCGIPWARYFAELKCVGQKLNRWVFVPSPTVEQSASSVFSGADHSLSMLSTFYPSVALVHVYVLF